MLGFRNGKDQKIEEDMEELDPFKESTQLILDHIRDILQGKVDEEMSNRIDTFATNINLLNQMLQAKKSGRQILFERTEEEISKDNQKKLKDRLLRKRGIKLEDHKNAA